MGKTRSLYGTGGEQTDSRHLQRIRLVVYDPTTNALINFWDIDVVSSSPQLTSVGKI